ncbi:MAG: RNA polymerase sigma-70 factor [Bacteroidales bacterium]|nr:RNA polymerase sigma-70 factor [Bacteroidales bacterium]
MAKNKSIVRRFAAGDITAFDQLYYAYSNKLYDFGLGLLKDPEKAGEMVQDVFVNLWEKRERINAELNFENYLLTIAYNYVRKYFRNKSIEQKVKNDLFKKSTNLIENTENAVIYNDLFGIAKDLIEKMPPKRKMVYKLSREEGKSINEISEILGISIHTVESHLSQALKYLKKEMLKYSKLLFLGYFLFH